MITQLKNRTLIRLSGKDVQPFLQGQFSNDIDALEEGVAQLNAYCQHQGKIIALIWVMRQEESFYLSFPADLEEVAVKRLNMFKMMSDVTITNVTTEIFQLGICEGDRQGLSPFKLNAQQSIALVSDVSSINFSSGEVWEQACIANEVPEVFLATSEKFVPQMLNLDIDEVGVSFTKGCYPGQEVVARLHYLGKSKRRMRAFECEQDLQVGDKLFALGSSSAKASGVVVRRVKLDSKFLCLATIEVAHEDGEITLNDAQGAPLIRINHD
ncbi:folate-binding protein YgfZ [Candidatus Thioglobus autotrophicus]|uniref:CAF17-like 4Fe-4S cluster assembly/insertion protein YgfZ n=1 Tax=Candidatus Thioglobus autotrophicus TaxID=1705394 RepID=UPI00299E3B6E|nr:folate-binding protein YgfZ [Candidatus Thioglobus autotrophicus]WPE16105.1 folate-binding protein YgfZ [Candidatus Thioglobus autotrophicus]